MISTLGHHLTATLARFAVVILGGLVGLGVPAGWIWIGSQFQGGTAPSWLALTIVHAGMITTLILIAFVFSFFVARSKRRGRMDWMQGMTEGRKSDSIATTHPFELIVIFAVFIDLIVFLVWFFFFADPGTPVGQG